MVRHLSGLEPHKLSATQLNIMRGSVFHQSAHKTIDFPINTLVDLSTQGLNGMDDGAPNGELYVYVISNGTEAGFICSKSRFASGVIYPQGFGFVRKLPWGVIYNQAWDGIPNHHLAHWPSPMLTFTDASSAAPWCALAQGSSTAWKDVDLTKWMPDNARLAWILCETRFAGAAGSAYIRSYDGQGTGFLVGSVSLNSAYQTCSMPIRVTSTRTMQFRTNTLGAQLYIYMIGYSITEPA